MKEPINTEEFAAIGRVVATFSRLEHEVLMAFISMLGGLEEVHLHLDRSERLISMCKKSFGQKLTNFIRQYRNTVGDDEWIRILEGDQSSMVGLRDQLAHGVWSRDASGKLKALFFSREAFSKDEAGVQMLFSVDELNSLARTNLDTAVEIQRRFNL